MTLGEVVTGLGFAVGAIVLVLEARRKRLATEGFGLVAFCGLAGGVIGAKVSELVFHGWPIRISFLAVFDPTIGGKALLGGVLFGWLGVEIAKRRLGIRRSTGDLFALALPAGEAVGRIGCFLNGCCYGTVCDSPLSVYQHEAWRHPAQLYSSASAAMIFLFLLWVRGRASWKLAIPGLTREGGLFRLYLFLFGVTRFGLEYVRQNNTFWWGLTPMQWFCLELMVYGGVSLMWRRQKVALPT